MSDYCTIADLKQSLPDAILTRLTDDLGTGQPVDLLLTAAIEDASAEIDGYIGGRVAFPLSAPYPGLLTKYSEDIAIYNLYSRIKEEYPQTRIDRYENAISFLKWYAEGGGSLGVEDPLPAPTVTGGLVQSREKIYTTTFLDAY